jgi:uncharacterized protein YfbU (UPF0304 family)
MLVYNIIKVLKRCDFMSLAEKFIKEFEALPEERKKEVIDFIEFIKVKESKNLNGMMDRIIEDNLEAFKELAK